MKVIAYFIVYLESTVFEFFGVIETDIMTLILAK